jgi:subfamily B ATP-binding cassette protein MsbA
MKERNDFKSDHTLTNRAIYGRLWREYIAEHRGEIWLAVVCMVLVAASTAASAWVMQPVLDKIFLAKDRTMLTVIPFVLLGIFVVKSCATYGQNVILQIMGQRIIATMQQQLYRHMIYADIGLFADQASGKLISRFTNDIYLLRQSVSTSFTGIIKEILSMVFLIGVMFYQSWVLAIFAFTVFPISVWPVIRLGKRMRKLSSEAQANLSNLAGQLDESFAGVRLVKSYAQEEHEITRANTQIEALFKVFRKAAKVGNISSPMMELLTGLAIAGIIFYGGAQVMEGTTTAGAFFSFIAAMIMAYKPAKTIASLSSNVQEGMAAAARLFSVLDTEPHIADAPDAKPLVLTDAAIAVENLSFSYHSSSAVIPAKAGIQNISLHIQPGQTVALVGPSGGGKSTLMNLMLRFYDPQAGCIRIDGQDIRHVTLRSLRESIALVSQETVLFDETIAANIAYGKPNATQEEIEDAARAAAAHEFIVAMPQGYQTMVGPRGVKLSGGQRQRLAIARALLKDAPILLLDEATSALDTQSESQVQQALELLMKGRTTLIIAHRLSTIRHADVIYVMDKGQIVESGTHERLLAQGGVYAKLYAQNLG